MTETCDYVPVLEPLPYLPPTLKSVCEKVCNLIDVNVNCGESGKTVLSALLHGQTGCGVVEVLRHVAAYNSVSLLRFDCLEFLEDSVTSTMQKIEEVFQES